MAKFDLSLFKSETLEFVDPIDTSITYTIPEITTDFFIEIQIFGEEMEKVSNIVDAVDGMHDMVFKILSLDKTKEITQEFIKERFNNMQILQAIILETSKFVGGQLQNPNSNSPISKPKTRKAK